MQIPANKKIEIILSKIYVAELSNIDIELVLNNTAFPSGYSIKDLKDIHDNSCHNKLNTDINIINLFWQSPLHHSNYNWLIEKNDDLAVDIYNFCSCIEVFIKFITSITISDVISSSYLSKTFKDHISNRIYLPTIEDWYHFFLMTINEIQQREDSPFIKEINDILYSDINNSLKKLVSLVDKIRDDNNSVSSVNLDEYLMLSKLFENVLLYFQYLKYYKLFACDTEYWFEFTGGNVSKHNLLYEIEPGCVALINSHSNNYLKLSPIISYRKCPDIDENISNCKTFSFYDAKTFSSIKFKDFFFKKVWFDRSAVDDFVKTFPIREWRMEGQKHNMEVHIDEIIHDFVGRDKDINLISEWINNNNSGFFFIKGFPGYGKSSLMAKLCKINFNNIDTIYYFIQRNDNTKPENILTILLNELALVEQNSFDVNTEEVSDLAMDFKNRLSLVGQKLHNNNRKILILIDGLDESLSAEIDKGTGNTILDYLPRNSCQGILFIFSTRKRKEVEDYYKEISDKSYKIEYELDGLNKSNILELFNKSNNTLTDEQANKLHSITNGSPLFLSILLRDISNGIYSLNNFDKFPSSLEDNYNLMLNRFIEDPRLNKEDRNNIYSLLILFSVMKEMINTDDTHKILDIPEDRIELYFTILREIFRVRTKSLYNKHTNLYFQENYYYLFHDSFSDYIKKHYYDKDETKDVFTLIIKYSLLINNDNCNKYNTCINELIYYKKVNANNYEIFIELYEKCNSFLTAHNLIYQLFINNSILNQYDLLLSLTHSPYSSTANLIIDCLNNHCQNNPDDKNSLLSTLLSISNKFTNSDQLNSYRILVNVLTKFKYVDETLYKNIFHAICLHRNEKVQILGMLSLFRIIRQGNTKVGINILEDICDRSIRYYIPNIKNIKVFSGCSIALLFDFCHDSLIRSELHRLSKKMFQKIWFIKPLTYVIVNIFKYFIDNIPVDYNPYNLTELNAYKKALSEDDNLLMLSNKLCESIDPNNYTSDEFNNLADSITKYSHFSFLSLLFHIAVVSRTTYGDINALETSYRIWNILKNKKCLLSQDFSFQVRVINQSFTMNNKELLDIKWIYRVEEVVRNYMYNCSGIFYCTNVYSVGALLHSLPTMSRYSDGTDLEILEEFVEKSLKMQIPFNEEQCKENIFLRPDMMLLKTAEVQAIECGTYDKWCKIVSVQILTYFINRHEYLEDIHWDYIGEIISRMKIYLPEDAIQLLNKFDNELQSKLQFYISKHIPKESVTSVIGMKVENFNAWTWSSNDLSEQSTRKWAQKFYSILAKNESFEKSLNGIVNLVIETIT